MKAVIFGWLLLLLVSVLNQFTVMSAQRAGRRRLALVLMLAVPSFVGFALAQIGVNLLGGGS